MRIPSIEHLESSVFKKPVNPRAASIFFGAFLDVGVEPTLAGKAASTLARLRCISSRAGNESSPRTFPRTTATTSSNPSAAPVRLTESGIDQ